jgi:hypothetical protein
MNLSMFEHCTVGWTKFTTLISLSLPVLRKFLFLIVGLKIYTLITFALKPRNKTVM